MPRDGIPCACYSEWYGSGMCEYHRKQLDKDSGATPRNTPAGSRGATSGDPAPERVQFAEQSAAEAKRTEKTAGRGSDKPRKRTVGSIVVPELPWKRSE